MILAKDYTDQEIEGWYCSEKYHGVRAYWDGVDFYSRNGNKFIVPEWYKEGLSETDLDGELWAGYGTFAMVAGICRRKKVVADTDWTGIRYMLFDAPVSGGPFADRLMALEQMGLPGHCHVIEQTRLHGSWQITDIGMDVLLRKGEGVVLRDPAGLYESGPSDGMLRKKFRQDAEAEVVGYNVKKDSFYPADSLVCVYEEEEFNLGIPVWVKNNLPLKGAMVTFSYQGLTEAGKPFSPKFVEVRDYE